MANFCSSVIYTYVYIGIYLVVLVLVPIATLFMPSVACNQTASQQLFSLPHLQQKLQLKLFRPIVLQCHSSLLSHFLHSAVYSLTPFAVDMCFQNNAVRIVLLPCCLFIEAIMLVSQKVLKFWLTGRPNYKWLYNSLVGPQTTLAVNSNEYVCACGCIQAVTMSTS